MTKNSASAIDKALYHLEREDSKNPINEIIEKALELAKKGFIFSNFSEVLHKIESDLQFEEDLNDINHYALQEHNDDTRSWLNNF